MFGLIIIIVHVHFEISLPSYLQLNNLNLSVSPPQLVAALTNIKPVNKTDAVTLLQNFGNLENLISASEDRLSQVIGLGPRKANKLYKTLQEPFLSK